jgi:hypothetical protein
VEVVVHSVKVEPSTVATQVLVGVRVLNDGLPDEMVTVSPE